MDVQAWLEERDRKLIQEHRQEALRDGLLEGRRDGLLEGRREGSFEPLRHLFERRLGRELTKIEQAALARRLDTDGALHITDVALDLAPDKLASYLAKTNEL